MEQLIDQQLQKKKRKKSRDLIGENGSVSCPTEGYLEVFEAQSRDNSEDTTQWKNKKKKIKDWRAENGVDKKLEEENSDVGFRKVSEILDSRSQESKNERMKQNEYLKAENRFDKELEGARISTKKRKRKDLEAVNGSGKELEEENSCAVFKETAGTQDSRRFENVEGVQKKQKKRNKDVKCEDFNENGHEEIPWRKEKKKKEKKNDAEIQTELSKKNSQTRESKGFLDDKIDERPLRYHGGNKDQFNENSVEESPSEYISVENDSLRKSSIKSKGSTSSGGKKAGAIGKSVGSQSIEGSQIIKKEKKRKKNKGLSKEESDGEVRNLTEEIEECTGKTMSVDKSMSIDGAVRFEESLEKSLNVDGLAWKENFPKMKKKKNRVDSEENLDELNNFEKSTIRRTAVERSAKRKKDRAAGERVEVNSPENTSNTDNLLHGHVNKEKGIYNVAVEKAENTERFANSRSKAKRKTEQKEKIKVSGDDDNHWATGDANNSRKDTVKSSIDDTSLHKKQKKVTFSSQVQVCETEERMDKEVSEDPWLTGEIPDAGDKQDQIVWGKRYGPEEDQAIRDAISKYIKEHGLAENEGLQMILNCRKYVEVRDCWKEIAAALPWRPLKSVYVRGHMLYERSNVRRWTQDEIEELRRLHNEHGKKWNKIAQVIGKSRYHVKDKWRAIRRGVMKRGPMSQDEYQRLSDLVHYNLGLKLSQKEQDRTHRRHRDNINWEVIADKMETRDHVTCCQKWYNSFVSSLIEAGLWESGDDKILLRRLLETNASNEEAVDWDDLVKGRSGEICHKRWKQMVRQLGEHRSMQLFEKIDLLVKRCAPELIE